MSFQDVINAAVVDIQTTGATIEADASAAFSGALSAIGEAAQAAGALLGLLPRSSPEYADAEAEITQTVATEQQTAYDRVKAAISQIINQPISTTIDNAVSGALALVSGIPNPASGTSGVTETNPTPPTPGPIDDIEAFFTHLVDTMKSNADDLWANIKADLPSVDDIEQWWSDLIPQWVKDSYTFVTEDLFQPIIATFTTIINSWRYYLFGVGDTPAGGPWNIGGGIGTSINTRQDIDAIITATQGVVTNPKGIFEVLFAAIVKGATAISSITATLEPIVEEIVQEAKSLNPIEPLSVATAIDLQYKGVIDAGAAQTNALRQGVSPADYAAMFNGSGYTPTPQEALSWYFRGFITEPALLSYLAQNHSLGVTSDALQKAAIQPATPQSAIASAGKSAAASTGFLPNSLNGKVPQYILDLYSKAQLDPGQAASEWVGHYTIPSPEWFAQAFFRGILPEGDISNAAIANNYPPEIAGVFEQLARPVLPVRITTALLSKGILDEATATNNYSRLGYTPADIATLILYAQSMQKTPKEGAASDLGKLALADGVGLFMDGVYSADQLTKLYEAHGYSGDAAALAVEYQQLKQAASDRKQNALDVVDNVNLGVYSETQGVENLQALGYTPRELLRAQKAMHTARAAKTKSPTSAEVKAMFKAGLIVAQDVTDYFTAQNYGAMWIPLLTQLVTAPAAAPAGG
jgi:hypothetical protein